MPVLRLPHRRHNSSTRQWTLQEAESNTIKWNNYSHSSIFVLVQARQEVSLAKLVACTPSNMSNMHQVEISKHSSHELNCVCIYVCIYIYMCVLESDSNPKPWSMMQLVSVASKCLPRICFGPSPCWDTDLGCTITAGKGFNIFPLEVSPFFCFNML